MEWYYAIKGKQSGPVDEETIRALAREGTLRPDDLVWNQAMGDEWAQAESVPGLFTWEEFPARSGERPGSGGGTNADITADARRALAGHWGVSIGVLVTYVLVLMVVRIVPCVGSLVSVIITGPMTVGLVGVFMLMVRGESPRFSELFSGFRSFGSAWSAYLLINIFIALWGLLFLVPGMVVMGIVLGGGQDLRELQVPPDSVPVAGLVMVLLCIPAMIAGLRYALTYFVLVENPGCGGLEAIRESKRLMQGRKWKLVCLMLRFVPWMLLCMLTCMIGFLFLGPYICASMARFYDDAAFE